MFELAPPTPIRVEHNLVDFDCGQEPLNDFLKRHALDKQNTMLSRTYVMESSGVVKAYYTLANIVVSQAESPKKFGRGMPDTIPALLMARLAVDKSAQGQGLGESLKNIVNREEGQ